MSSPISFKSQYLPDGSPYLRRFKPKTPLKSKKRRLSAYLSFSSFFWFSSQKVGSRCPFRRTGEKILFFVAEHFTFFLFADILFLRWKQALNRRQLIISRASQTPTVNEFHSLASTA
jgi:hypothetical protein